MSYDAEVKIPSQAEAVIISPSIVGDRYVQLTPAYTSGDVMADDTVLEEEQTSVPLELDQIYSSIDQLTVALGPTGANENGALSDLLETTAKNFGGEGAKFQPDDPGLRHAERDPRQQQGGAVRLGRRAGGLHLDARRERRHRARLQPVAWRGVHAARGRA